MSWENYRDEVVRELRFEKLNENNDAVVATLGLAGEVGELCEVIKKGCCRAGKELNRDAALKEAGDVLWYFTWVLDTLGLTLDEVMESNRAKLFDRHGVSK